MTGDIRLGESVLTVTYRGLKANLTVNVVSQDPGTGEEITVAEIIADFVQNGTVIYAGGNLDELRDMLTVTAVYSDGKSREIKDYELSGELKAGNSVITVTYSVGDKTVTVTIEVDVTPVILDGIHAEFTQGAAKVYNTTSLDELRNMLAVTAVYSDEIGRASCRERV